jgi:hypothetical protein
VPCQCTASRLSSFWHHFKPHRANESNTQSQFHPLSWIRNIVWHNAQMMWIGYPVARTVNSWGLIYSGQACMCLPSIVLVYYWFPFAQRDYHTRKKKPITSSSRPLKTHTMQQPSTATQGAPSSSQLPSPTAPTTSTLSAVTGTAVATGTGTTLHPHITLQDSGWRTHFILWICCIPI